MFHTINVWVDIPRPYTGWTAAVHSSREAVLMQGFLLYVFWKTNRCSLFESAASLSMDAWGHSHIHTHSRGRVLAKCFNWFIIECCLSAGAKQHQHLAVMCSVYVQSERWRVGGHQTRPERVSKGIKKKKKGKKKKKKEKKKVSIKSPRKDQSIATTE